MLDRMLSILSDAFHSKWTMLEEVVGKIQEQQHHDREYRGEVIIETSQ
jgi:hypothetical protein